MPPELLAILDALPTADLHRLRLDTIPRLLRERVADDRAAEYAAHQAEYEAQGRPQK